ncbi:Carbohydrate binding domain-containing protein [Histomonas meleagridis]|uniref:Carbohydrate binding domain-containing protein n=1 Tax=Histomonas meleagridis TaxID=135588 RepID=UPI00355A850D|nr:Carbohydrate binding domain-containing protein [Histomonas meleagridis]KAH0801027.1 Carbohydrate binding domain-containing protein [Histomonas meleagridis]
MGNLNMTIITHITLELSDDEMKLTFSRDPQANFDDNLPYWPLFQADKNDKHFIPYGEGILIYADINLNKVKWVGAGVNGLSMPFIGTTNGEYAMLTYIETQADAGRVGLLTNDDTYTTILWSWESEKHKWGYDRIIRYSFFPGNHVTIAKRYRNYAKEKGLVVPFTEKRKTRPLIDKFIGSGLIYYESFQPIWEETKLLNLTKEMQSLGMEKLVPNLILDNSWHDEERNVLYEMQGVLTSSYELFSSVNDPEWIEKGWTGSIYNCPETFPDAVQINETGQFVQDTWPLYNRSEECQHVQCPLVYAYDVCQKSLPSYVRNKIENEMKTTKIGAKYLDTRKDLQNVIQVVIQ